MVTPQMLIKKIVYLMLMAAFLAGCSGGSGGGKSGPQVKKGEQNNSTQPARPSRQGVDEKGNLGQTTVGQIEIHTASDAVQVTAGQTMSGSQFEGAKSRAEVTEGRSQSASQQKASTQTPSTQAAATGAAHDGFDIRIIFESDVETDSSLMGATTAEKDKYIQAVRKLYSRLDVDGAYRAIPVVDSLYEKSHLPTEKSPYITADLYQAVVETGACDINAVGACLVVEKDIRNNSNIRRAYYIATAPESPRSRLVRVVRRNLDLTRGLYAQAELVTAAAKGNQILVFAQVASLKDSRGLLEDAYGESQAGDNRQNISPEQMDKIVDEVVSVSDEKTKSEFAKRQREGGGRGQALAGSCFLAADLKVKRRFIGIMLPKTYYDDADQKRYKPTKAGKGRLYCYLPGGVRQMPRVEVEVVDRFVSLGWRLSKGTEKFGATGIGWAVRGAQDIIAIGSFRYLVSVDSSISNLFWNQLPGLWKSIGFFVRGNLTPIILGGKKGHGGVLATAGGIGLSKNIWSEASVSVLGEITINYDRDDL